MRYEQLKYMENLLLSFHYREVPAFVNNRGLKDGFFFLLKMAECLSDGRGAVVWRDYLYNSPGLTEEALDESMSDYSWLKLRLFMRLSVVNGSC